MNFHPRHGTIIPITRHELLRITDEWGKPVSYTHLDVYKRQVERVIVS